MWLDCCELPRTVSFEGYFQYNPDLPEQPEEVQWIIRGSFSILPGLSGLLGTVALLFFTLRTKEQHQEIVQGILSHQAGVSVKDPLTGLLLPPIKTLSDGSAAWQHHERRFLFFDTFLYQSSFYMLYI